MVLEAVMICIDNSEYMRNGDYNPTRLQAQNETVNKLTNAKLDGNLETCVGILAMAGRRIEVHNSLSREVGDMMTSLKERVHIQGKCDFLGGLKIAQLGLKNRQNKKQAQRIIMFVGSPVDVKQKELVQLGKKFKKNNIAVDVVNFGAENAMNDNTEKLEAFIGAVNSSDNSHLVNVPPGPHILSDLVISSEVMAGDPSAQAAARMGGATAANVDANEDPELAMALRMSMEEEKQRQERLAAAQPKTEPTAASASETPATPSTTTAAATPAAPTKAAEAAAEPMQEEDEPDSDEERAMLEAAIAMSMEEGAQMAGDDEEGDDEDVAAAIADRDFVQGLLSSVPGIDNDDIALDDILNNLVGDDDDDDEDEEA